MPPDGGRARATSYDVARAAGVSQSTVSRCFQDDSNISAATRARVLAASERLGYMPNALARSLITQRSDLVGIIATRYTLRGNPDVTYALSESLGGAGKQFLLFTVEDDRPGLTLLRRALEYPLGGLISCVQLTDDQLAELRRRQIPVVLYNRSSGAVPIDTVTADHEQASGELARLLLAAGHRRFLCIGGPRGAPVSQLRLAGFNTQLAAHGVQPCATVYTDYSYAEGAEVFRAYLREAPRPDAVFCANDQIAMGVMDTCRFERGWALPEDISVVGFDDVAEAGRATYRLTTVRQHSVEMAHAAVGLLLSRLAEPDREAVRTVVPAHLIRRNSARLAAA